MIVVLDANAALEIALNREQAKEFKELLRQSDVVIAPDIFPSEITNSLWKYARFAQVSGEKCEQALDYCMDLIDDLIETRSICREVFAESIKRKHPAYDIFYLVLARRNNASILSRDKKMKRLATDMQVEVLGTSTD